MNEAEAWFARLMARLGRDVLIASTENDADSIWVDDEMRVPVAGYYIRRRQPLPHRTLRDGRTFIIEFERAAVHYRLSVGSETSYDDNALYAMRVVKTLLQWIDDHVITWEEAFRAFVRERESDDVWWRVLRLPPDANRNEIDEGYRRAALRAHPDRGGSNAAFQRVRSAYERAVASRTS